MKVYILLWIACSDCNKTIIKVLSSPPTDYQQLDFDSGNGWCGTNSVIEAEVDGEEIVAYT